MAVIASLAISFGAVWAQSPNELPAPPLPAVVPMSGVLNDFQFPTEEESQPRDLVLPEPMGDPRPNWLDPQRDLPIAPEVTPASRSGSPGYDPPLGFSGRSSVVPSLLPNQDFAPIEDRWRIGYPVWDRYNKGQPALDDYPFEFGRLLDPFNQNVLKGDYPIIGQDIFLTTQVTSLSLFEGRQIPTATTPFESTAREFTRDFFGRPNQFIYQQFLFVSLDLNRGDAAFKPTDWRIKVTGAFNANYLDAEELAVVSPDVRRGTSRGRSWVVPQEWFLEYKIADLSVEYDFLSVRAGQQPFTSDFRGFIFSDINRGIRLFGSLNGNRDQFNLVYFDQAEKDTNSLLNEFDDRNQNVLIANYYRQDFIFPGYTMSASVHYNNDAPSLHYDKNGFLVRPDPVGVFRPHRVETAYLGFAGDGHIGRYNISHAFYWAVGRDSRNLIANKPQDISGQMAALELSYDRDWIRFRASGFYSSGDGNVNNNKATGFDSILDNPIFAGGEFSFWQRQNIPLFGVNLTQRGSLIPDLRSSKVQGQANFVNPGLWLINGGFDIEITPRLRMINNANFLMFDKTNSLETFIFQGAIDREIGTDVSIGFEYRPLLSNNVIFLAGVSMFTPANGFKQIYNKLNTDVDPLYAGFLEVALQF